MADTVVYTVTNACNNKYKHDIFHRPVEFVY